MLTRSERIIIMIEFFTNNFWTITLVSVGIWIASTVLEKIVTKKRMKNAPAVDEKVNQTEEEAKDDVEDTKAV